jgi:hypothetical protein
MRAVSFIKGFSGLSREDKIKWPRLLQATGKILKVLQDHSHSRSRSAKAV